MSLFTVVRDPIERFISGFTDKCILEAPKFKGPQCYGCEGNVTCFVEKQYARMMNYVSGQSRAVGYEDIHFNPQSWSAHPPLLYPVFPFRYCSFRHRLSAFQIVKYRTGEDGLLMIGEILDVLRRAGVEKRHLGVIKKDITSGSLH